MAGRPTHFDSGGRARMVDVSGKETTSRTAIAGGRIEMSEDAEMAVRDCTAAKGDVIGLARVAGIMASKRTQELIPLCHPLRIDSVDIDFDLAPGCLECTCTVRGRDRTGFEMEALTGVAVALLTVYDMVKAVDHEMTICDVRLLEKSGGKSGEYRWQG